MNSSLKIYDYFPEDEASFDDYDSSSHGLDCNSDRHGLKNKKRKNQKNKKLSAKQRFQVYSSSPDQRLSVKLKTLTKAVFNLSIIGLIGAACTYFCLLSFEFELSKNLSAFEQEMKTREDLRSYLGRAYSWANIDKAAKENNLSEASHVEIADSQKTNFHKIFELDI